MDYVGKIQLQEEHNIRPSKYCLGDRAMRYAPTVNLNVSNKLMNKFKYCEIIKIIGKNTYVVKDDDGTEIVCDGRNLRHCYNAT